MVTPMILTIIGEKIPEEKQSGTIGLITGVSTPLLSTVAGLTIAFVLSRGWQTAFQVYVFPIMLLSLIVAFIVLPKTTSSESLQPKKTGIREGFSQIVGHRSALACLLGSTFSMIAWGGIIWYFVSFYQQTYGVSTATVGIIWSANTSIYVVGSLLCGRIIPKIGVKRMTSISSLFIGLSIAIFTNIQNYYLAIGFGLLMPLFASFWSASSNTLSLRQVPEYTGAMMSLNSGSSLLGRAFGSAIGGLSLNYGGYGLMGIVMGVFGVLAFLAVSVLVQEPFLEIE